MMESEPHKLRLRDLVLQFTIPQLWSVLGALVILLVGAFSLGYWVRGLENVASLKRTEMTAIIAELFRNFRNEEIKWKDSDRILFAENVPGKTTIFIELEEAPILQSVRLQVGVYTAPPGSYENIANVLLLASNINESQFKGTSPDGVSVSYVPDMAASVKSLKLKRQDKKIFAGDRLLFDGNRTLWPSGGAGPFEEY